MRNHIRVLLAIIVTLAFASVVDAAGPESKRLGRAKDLIADEQWAPAIDELRAAAADPKEPRKDEALFWLAHSLNQSGDRATAVETISRLEREYPASMWVKPAGALRIEIAARLNRSDVLWWTAQPKAPTKLPPDKGPRKATDPAVEKKPPFPEPFSAKIWYGDSFNPDMDLQIQALGALMKTDADRVIPLLGDIAFESPRLEQANRAVFMLAQSDSPKARDMVVQVAKGAPQPVRVAAVKALGKLGGADVSKDLMLLYGSAQFPVKYQIVQSLGERADKISLVHIVESEKDVRVRYKAVEGLGQAGAVDQLAKMYKTAAPPAKRPIIIGLFIARADVELIRIAETDGDAELRRDVFERLRLLGTPRAKEYLQKVSETR